MRVFHQRGVTLISLLIGMVVSLLAILACLTMFNDLIRVSGEAKVDAVQDGSLATALLRIQTELQGIGYGMGPNRVVAGVPLDYSVATQSVAWRFNDWTPAVPNNKKCQRLESVTTDGVFSLKLQKLKTANLSECETAVNIVDITLDKWEDSEILSQVKFYDSNTPDAATATHVLVTFAPVAAAVCGPYGAGVTIPASSSGGATPPVPDNHPIISITKKTAAKVNDAADAVFEQVFKVCLVNIVI